MVGNGTATAARGGDRRLTPERRRQLTRDALIDAAADVFSRDGYHGASLQDIAEAAGFTRGAVYSNFSGKEDLFFAVVERSNAELLAAYAAMLEESSARGVVDLERIAEMWTETHQLSVDAVRLMLEFRLFALRNPELLERLAAFERRNEESVAALLQHHADIAGIRFRVPTSDLATIIYAGQQGLHQHLLTCSTNHDGLFERFLALVTAPL